MSQCKCKARSDKTTDLGVVSSPFGREIGGKLLASSFGLRSLHAIHTVDKGSEVALSLATSFAVEPLLGVFLRAEDNGRITLTIGSAISVSDTDIKDSHMVPRRQKPWTATSPLRSRGRGESPGC